MGPGEFYEFFEDAGSLTVAHEFEVEFVAAKEAEGADFEEAGG